MKTSFLVEKFQEAL